VIPAERLAEAAMFAAVLGGVFGLIGWYFGHWYHHATIGLWVGLSVAGLIYAASTEETSGITFESIAVFILGVPLVYGLVLFTQISLLVFGLISFSAHTFFVRSILGALVGTGVCAALNLRGTVSSGLGAIANDEPPELNKRFWTGLSLRAPFAFMIAGTFVIPGHKFSAIVAFGAAWGMVAAAAVSFFTVLVERKSVREGWFSIAVAEYILVILLFGGIFHHALLELALPAALACAATYGLIYLIAILLPGAARIPATALLERRRSSKGNAPPPN